MVWSGWEGEGDDGYDAAGAADGHADLAAADDE